jgi:3-hydroxybutyryl-CoA dehydrogenase
VLNRLQGALLHEALWLVENDIATPQDVDVAIKNSIGRRWAVAGIFEIFEIAGWDLLLAIAEGLFPHLASSSEVSPLLKSKVERGELGVKTGKGFYEWTPEAAEELKQRIAKALVKLEKEA